MNLTGGRHSSAATKEESRLRRPVFPDIPLHFPDIQEKTRIRCDFGWLSFALSGLDQCCLQTVRMQRTFSNY